MQKQPWEIMNEAFDRIFAAFEDHPATECQPEAAPAGGETPALCWFEQGDAARWECGCKACTKWLETNEEHDEHCGCKGCADAREYSDSIRQDLIWSKGGL